MSAMEQMLESVLKKVLPKHFIDMLSVENIQKVKDQVAEEWLEIKETLKRIDLNTQALLAHSGAAGYGARIFIEQQEGIIDPSSIQPENSPMLVLNEDGTYSIDIEVTENDRCNSGGSSIFDGYGNRLNGSDGNH